MNKNIIIGILVIALGVLGYVGLNKDKVFGSGSITGIQAITSGVYAIASTTEAWTASETTGTSMSVAVNSSTTVGTTAVQVLAPNTGRMKASVCNTSAVAGFVSFNNSVTSTPGKVGYFVLGTGVYVPAGSCINL